MFLDCVQAGKRVILLGKLPGVKQRHWLFPQHKKKRNPEGLR
jgi:hypothetical protein